MQVLEDDMLRAGQEERELAIKANSFHQGVPAITVICDGGWSKRSHKHTYNALGGVAIIIGAATKKLLHIGVRNKTCYICTQAETKEMPAKEHVCYKNWTESSQAMESDIILEGFLEAETKHNVRFMKFIGDGDSSVFATIQQKVPVWGRDVQKLECANHACKCLRSNLEKLVVERPHLKGKGKLTNNIRIRLTTANRCAIRRRSKEKDRKLAVRKLRHDIMNSIDHVLGHHSQCNADFCKVAQGKQKQDMNIMSDDVTEEVLDVDAFEESILHWTEGTKDSELEESRGASKDAPEEIDSEVRTQVKRILARLADKADRLIANFTTNMAESWMSIRMKLDGGKIFNR